MREGGPPAARAGARDPRRSAARAAPAPRPRPRRVAHGPKLANPDKVLFPRDGITKREIWDYYTAIAPLMLPHLAGRPLTLQRYPNGIDEAEWYQQNAPEKTPDFVRLVDSGPRHDHKKRIVCDNVETLQWLANLAALTLHGWSAHVPPQATSRAAIDHALGQPDYVVLDLDPGDGPWSHLVEVARHVHALLDALELHELRQDERQARRARARAHRARADARRGRRRSPSRSRARSSRCCRRSRPSSA